MSDYDQEQIYEQYDEGKPKHLFHYDNSLLSSVDNINDWKDNINLPVLQYLQRQSKTVAKSFELFNSGNQIRCIAFYNVLDKGFEQLVQKYKKAFQTANEKDLNIQKRIKQLDQEMKLLVKNLQSVQANNIMNLCSQLYETKIPNIYSNLRKIVDFCVDLEVLWLTLLTPRSFRQQQNQNLYKINYGAPLIYYQKQLRNLHERIKRAQIKNFILFPKNEQQLLLDMCLIINNKKLKENLKTKIISLLKGQHYALKKNKTLKQEFIISSLQMYNGQQTSQLWDYELYQNLCIQTLKKSFTDLSYLDCTIFMEPQNIQFQRRKRTIQFAQIYYALIQKILSLRQKEEMMENNKEIDCKVIQIPLKFIKQIMTHSNIVLLGHLYVNFLISNKNAFSINNPQLHKYLFGILQNMKQIYISFGTNQWLVPNSILYALTYRFFNKFSQDIKNDIADLLPVMVRNLGEDKLPHQPVIYEYVQEGITKYNVKIQRVLRSQLLLTIFSYIKDAQYKDHDFYLDLPQVTPSNFETAVMFIRSLQLKLRHHEPTQDQKKLWTLIIEEASNSYKIRANLKWFKPKKKLDLEQRQAQFLIHKQIKQKWAFEIVQDALNYRDQQKYEQIISNDHLSNLSLQNDLINYFKYAIGINIKASNWSSKIQDYEIFSLLDKMRAIMDINFGDIVNLKPDQLVTLNQLHICLMFYNTKIRQAKGNQIYALIIYKIIIPWLESTDQLASQQFQKKFFQFFENFIVREYYLTIGDSLIMNLNNLQANKANLLLKLNFYLQIISNNEVLLNLIENNAQFLQKLFSVLHENIDVKVLITIVLIILKFMQIAPDLEQYVSLGFVIDLLVDPKFIDDFLTEVFNLGQRERDKILIEFTKKLPQIIHTFSPKQINKILKEYLDNDYDSKNPTKLLNILDQVPQQKKTISTCILQALIAQRDKLKRISNVKDNPNDLKQLQQNAFKYWKKLEEYIDKYTVERKNGEEQVNLNQWSELFQESVFKKMKQDYKKILMVQIRKKRSSKKKSNFEKKSSLSVSQSQKQKQKDQSEKNKQITINDKFKQAKIWRKLVKNFGTFEDVILFGEDPLQVAGSTEDQMYQKCIKIIKQRTIQQKYLKKIIRKIPLLKKCAQDIVKQISLQKQVQFYIQPELICKLIMINSRYRSAIVQQFILTHIARIPIPIKIYQDYLALDIKKKMQSLPNHLIQKVLFEKISKQQMKKIDQIFEQLIYLPIKKFQNIYLKFQNKIQQTQQGQNQQWETQSQGQDNQQDEEFQQEEQTNLQKKKSKKKSSKKQSLKQQVQQVQKVQQNELPQKQVKKDEMVKNSSQAEIDDNSADQDEQQIDEDDEDDYESGDQQMGQEHSKIVDMFYKQNDQNIAKYKNFIKLRQQINVSLNQNYFSLEKLQEIVKSDPELQKKIFRAVDILQNQLNEQEILIQILNKLPENFYKLLKNFGLTRTRDEQKVLNYRKQVTKMPGFIKDYMSDREQNSENDQEDYLQDDVYDDEDSLSQQSNSLDDLDGFGGDQLLFVINQDGQLESINADELTKNQKQQQQQEQDRQSGQIKIAQKLQEGADQILTLPYLKQINSHIQTELTGKQLGQTQMVKILQIAIIKLFSLYSYQLKQKPIQSFYGQLIKSKQGKIFIDTLLTILRIDQKYTLQQRFNLSKHLNNIQLSISKALANFLYVAVDITTEESKDAKQFSQTVRDQVRQLLPIGDHIMIKSDIPVQDNFLTLLIFYSRYSQSNVHQKIKIFLSSLSQQVSQYELTKAKAAILTRHVYKNNNSSSIWNHLQQKFRVNIDSKVKFSSCITVYGQLLREDIEKCYNNLLQIVGTPIQVKDQQDLKQAKLVIKQQQKKVEQNLRKHFKQIKHYYYWNKRNFMSEMEKQEEKKPVELLKNKQLIKLTQLMIFYCHFLKKKFFQKIDSNAMRNLLVLPKSLIQTAFMFLWKLDAKINNWQPLSKVKQYFKSHKLYEYKFNKLQQVCNLVLQFLQMPQFSNSKFKQVIIPYFINNPENAHQIPLIFKLPDIPEQHNGQRLYLTRQCSFDMAFYQLVAKSITVQFHNEEGSDHGGMVRQLMMGWTGVGIGEQHIFIGKLLAISFRKSIPYGGDFDIAMAVAITQYKVSIQFFEQVDPQVAQSLKYVRDADPQDLDLKFEITKQYLGQIRHYPLIPNGQQITVTNQNKEQYLQLFLRNYFLVGRQWQLSQICIGFFSIVNKKYAAIFSPLQMIQKIQGQQISDYMKIKNKTKYQEGYTQSSQMIKWFWQIVSQFNQKQMNKFLQFITGAPKVSIYNHNFSFVIEKPYGEDQSRLPVAHTCFNTLQLPEYKTKQILEKKLTQAIYEGNDNFGIL